MKSILLAFVVFLSVGSAWAEDLKCEEKMLDSLSPIDRRQRGPGDENLTIFLSERSSSDEGAESLLWDVQRRKWVRFEERFLQSVLFPKTKLLESWTWQNYVYEKTKGCMGGEILRLEIVCEKNLLAEKLKCSERCVYTNIAEDCSGS